MAEKILKTRIQLKYDTWDNWQKTDVANKGGNLVLKAGEVAVTVIASGKSDFTTPPTVMFKVGDGTSKFSELPWASGLAADVYAWAKKAIPDYNDLANKPTIPTIPTIGNGKITIKQGTVEKGSFTVNQTGATTITLDPDTDTDTQYQLALSGHTLKFQSKAKGEEEFKDISGQSFTLPDNNTTYTFVEGTTEGAFTVTPSGGTATSVKIHGLGTAAYVAKTAFATADQGAKADSALQSVKTLNTNNTTAQTASASEAIDGSGTINLHKVSKTGSYNDLLNKPTIPTVGNGALTIKVGKEGTTSGTGSFTANQSSASTITLPVYTKEEVDAKITGAVQYLGTVDSADDLAALTPDSVGDFCRVSTAFGSYHVGDLLLCKTLKTSSAAATWDVIHGEIDKDTWTANSKASAGYVAAGGSNVNKVWKTDASGNPGWRDDANTTYTGGTGISISGNTINHSNSVTAGTAQGEANKTLTFGGTFTIPSITYDAQGHITGKSTTTMTMPGNPNTDTKVTSAANHYTPTADSASQLSVDASSTTAATWNSTSLVTGVNLQRDSKGHVVGVTVDSVKLPANPNTDTNQKVKANEVSFDANDTVDMKAGTGLKVTASNTTAGSEYIQYDIDDSVVFVLNGGSSTEVI